MPGIDRRQFLRAAGAGALAATLARAAGAAASPARPNIILYLTDDHGIDFVGCYGNAAVRTPNIDRLAAEGMRFTRMFAASPTCAPSRSALYTGLHSARNGCMGNHTQCKPDVRSLAHYLSALGYRVVLAHKSHVGPKEVFPFEMLKADLPVNPKFRRRYRMEGLDTAVIDRFLATHAAEKPNQPLCLVVADSGPHVLWEKNHTYDPATLPVPPIMVDTPKTRTALANYYQDITTVDGRVGQVMASLEKHGFAKNSLVLYTADQGPEWPHCKWTLYDTGLRVPFIARWPGRINPGTTSSALLSLVDVLATFIEVAGGGRVRNLDGSSILPNLLGESNQGRDEIYASHTGDGDMNVFPQRCVRDGRYKYILNLKPQNRWTTHFTKVEGIPDSHRDVYATWEEKAKTDPQAAELVRKLEQHPAEELYDTESDRWELNNLAALPDHNPRLESMRAKVLAWMKRQEDPALEEAMRVLNP